MRAPAWARNEQPDFVETASEKMRSDVARDRLHLRGVGHLPLDPSAAAWELQEGDRALRSSRPRNRRWRALEKFEQEIDRLAQRQAEASARVQQAEATLASAPDDDARTLAKWLAAGEKGERPAATVYERERERDAARLLLEAVTLELDEAIDRRVQHIEKNRQKMIADVRHDLDEARAALLAHVRELPALREALVSCRESLLWAASFPEPVESWGSPGATALGLREPVERTLQTTAIVQYAALIEVLEVDAAALAEAFNAEQAQRLGVDAARTPLREAMWDSDPDHVAWKKAELERARQIAEWSPSPDKLAEEARDFRP